MTDRPSAIRNVERYLATLGTTVQRQVEIEAKLYDVTLNDQFQLGLDWQQIIKSYGGQFQFIWQSDRDSPAGGVQLKENAFSMIFSNRNTSVVLSAMQEQGDVSVISQPRLRTLNNQTALIKVGTDTPFFSQNIFSFPRPAQPPRRRSCSRTSINSSPLGRSWPSLRKLRLRANYPGYLPGDHQPG